jgi:hypothetical protein
MFLISLHASDTVATIYSCEIAQETRMCGRLNWKLLAGRKLSAFGTQVTASGTSIAFIENNIIETAVIELDACGTEIGHHQLVSIED